MSRKPRTLVLCFDGTADSYGTQNTNVIKFYSMLKKNSVEDQLCYYQAGIGTYYEPGVVRPAYLWAARILDEAFAWYLSTHVLDGYRFLMQNYNAGDKVCLFGFSRGAYTARALAGMLHKVGLLSKDNNEQVSFAYKIYASSSKSREAIAAGFKSTFSRSVPIEFLGVWDTVASVGVVMTRTLPFVATNTTIKTFRHALSLDEHRAMFRPNLYHHPSKDQPKTFGSRIARSISAFRAGAKAAVSSGGSLQQDDELGRDEKEDLSDEFLTDVKEVWFAGCHTDVGGGSVPDATAHALANIPLRWMAREVVLAGCGVHFTDAALAQLGVCVSGGEKHSGDDGVWDALDAVQPMHDQLKKKPVWWILEVMPSEHYWQDRENKWETRWSVHLGRGRFIPDDPMIHRSVLLREGTQGLRYRPRARYVHGTETYVE